MDLNIDELLKKLREDIDLLKECTSIDLIYALQKRIPEQFSKLDKHLSAGKYLPADWNEGN